MVIAISHLGYGSGSNADYYDRGLAAKTKHIDMIIGGHSHTTLRKADLITDLDGDQIPVVQTGSKGLNLGYAKIKLDDKGKPSFTYRLIPVNSRLDDRIDPAFSSIIDDYAAEVKEKMDVKLGYAPYEIKRGTPESPLGNLSADGLIWAAKKFHNVDADVAVYNSGGVRANISKGDVTLGDVYAAFPFDNVLSMLTITGKNLRFLMYEVPYNLYVNKEVKIVSSSSGWVDSITINGKAIDDKKEYTVVTIDYISDNDAYTSILGNPIKREDSVEIIRDYFGEYFKHLAEQNKGQITASTDGRITIK
jgi:2',3'-cyclic-nucleotide 2'-phosphodiesterase (5'-nucleotidase family)